MSALADPVRAELAEAAGRMAALAEGLARVDGVLIWGVPRRIVRAYVWALHTGADPLAAVVVKAMGREILQVDPNRSRSSAWAHGRAQVKRLESFNIRVPVAEPGRAAA